MTRREFLESCGFLAMLHPPLWNGPIIPEYKFDSDEPIVADVGEYTWLYQTHLTKILEPTTIYAFEITRRLHSIRLCSETKTAELFGFSINLPNGGKIYMGSISTINVPFIWTPNVFKFITMPNGGNIEVLTNNKIIIHSCLQLS